MLGKIETSWYAGDYDDIYADDDLLDFDRYNLAEMRAVEAHQEVLENKKDQGLGSARGRYAAFKVSNYTYKLAS